MQYSSTGMDQSLDFDPLTFSDPSFSSDLKIDFDLKSFHTFQLKSRSRFFYELIDPNVLPKLLAWANHLNLPVFILGGGSNLLPDEYIDGLVVKLKNQGITLLKEDEESFLIEAAAGVEWHNFVMQTVDNGWYGLENLVLIPGTVGASPVQNIGAYGLEVSQRIVKIQVYDRINHKIDYLLHHDCDFGYRSSIFKQQPDRWIILGVHFRLFKKPTPILNYTEVKDRVGLNPTPQAIADAVIHIRSSKLPDPFATPNAGSFFKNPVISTEQYQKILTTMPNCVGNAISPSLTKLAAGWLIEQCNWKGRCLGKVGMFEKQALVMVNHGEATLKDVSNLSRMIQQDVQKKFNVILEPEPVVWSTRPH